MSDKPDTLFSSPVKAMPFAFDQKVAEVFPDMIKRSVPGYPIMIKHIEKFASKYVKQGTNCYDLGCSLGAASLAMSQGIQQNGCKVIGIDNSEAMLTRCQQHIDAFKHQTEIELHLGDVTDFPMSNASMVALNFTLQFIDKNKRVELLTAIYEALNPGGILVLSEKVSFDDPQMNQLMIDVHHEFKKENGYSDLEISQKRNSLENVLIPETLPEHLKRLKTIGFKTADCWFQQFNFMSIVAIK
ncbi:carboxy-S-adenosyl-L-methionine synthase CmoA [Aliikangiella marina]|uniref:Carboxy-S-adenosyl-L-methionine synthase n=1 Tax=Aliikangiella marina TaxID=1712262 RepID=A0A545T395_9GAMM|nr:carboxy-S-adenosyl-L-methionine synthase CmoA [Aliikangiella marina]TQV71664.1 carboxy-S-adenosyl-L-methionine synthase CmoA [Aliikangiella marina]TQV71679.1 carboxy-S-adenosyl-L-methionine synthase CmoA [Aliikangiella marina]